MFEFKLPDLGEGIHEGELLQWHVAVGDAINEDDPLCEMETDKAAVTIPSPRTGTIAALNAEPGETVEVGHVFVVIDTDTRSGERIIAAPATRRLAREMGIDIQMVEGSGPGGRVTPEDLKAFDSRLGVNELTPKPAPRILREDSTILSPGKETAIPFLEISGLPEPDGPVERLPIRSLRKKVAVKMTSSSLLIPHVAHMDEVDVTEIDGLRQEYNLRQSAKIQDAKGKLTLLAFVVKAVAARLKDYPMFNASVDLMANEIVYKKYYHIGFAADTPRGLMVPVIHDANLQSLSGTGYRIRHLAKLARDGEISVAELTRGTFTITNVGAIGGTHVFPIINSPETAILGLGRVEKKPVVRDDEIRIRKMLPVTLCFDHRVADGAQAASFVRDVKIMLEDSLDFMSQI